MTTAKTAYQKPTCRGSYALGTACQKCERCAEERALLGAPQPVGRSAEVQEAIQLLKKAWEDPKHYAVLAGYARTIYNYITALESHPKAPASAVECARAWAEYCDGMGGTPDGDDYLVTLITAHTASAVAEAREMALEEAAQLVKELSHQNGDTIEVIRIRALKG